jgi:hypothetical protein
VGDRGKLALACDSNHAGSVGRVKGKEKKARGEEGKEGDDASHGIPHE